jgi:cytoskeletal protein CcmA (bactofilin family)
MQTENEMTEVVGGRIRHRGGDGHAAGNITLGPKDSLIGKLTFDGDIRVSGKVEGDLKVTGDVSVDDGGNESATVEGNNVNVRGNLTGNVTAKGKLSVGGAGTVMGDVKVARLSVEDGGTLNGNVSMVSAGSHGSSSSSSSEGSSSSRSSGTE